MRDVLSAVDLADQPFRLTRAELSDLRGACIHELGLIEEFERLFGRPATSVEAFTVFWGSNAVVPLVDLPIDVLFFTQGRRRRSSFVHPHSWTGEIPPKAFVRLDENVSVTSPAFTLLQLAASTSFPRVAAAAAELMGTFAVYDAPPCVRELLEHLNATGELPSLGAWRPSFDRSGKLTNVWSRPPLLSADDLVAMADSCRGVRGARRLREVAALVRQGAASPFEAQAGLLLALPASFGGMGFEGLVFNQPVTLSSDARRIARRQRCYCDLFWPGEGSRHALDLECQSASHHEAEDSYLSDNDRSAALQLMDVDVVGVTYGQIASPARFEALSRLVGKKLGLDLPEPDSAIAARQAFLRAEVICDWRELLTRARLKDPLAPRRSSHSSAKA